MLDILHLNPGPLIHWQEVHVSRRRWDHDVPLFALVLHIKLRLGKKLCKLQVVSYTL